MKIENDLTINANKIKNSNIANEQSVSQNKEIKIENAKDKKSILLRILGWLLKK